MDERRLRIERRFEWPMVIAALLVISLLVIEESDFGEPWDSIGVILNWGTWLAFVVGYTPITVAATATARGTPAPVASRPHGARPVHADRSLS